MLTRRVLTQSLLAGVAVAGAGGWTRAAVPDPQSTGKLGLDLKAMDPSIAAGDDFFRHVSGAWLKSTTIPSDRGRWVEFSRLDDLNAERGREILEEAARTPRTPEEKKLGDFYFSLMDSVAIEGAATGPLKPELARIAAISTPADLARAIAQLSRDWLRPLPGGGTPMPPTPFLAGVSVDDKDPTRYRPSLNQGGLGLPDRDYFLVMDNPGFAKARTAYRAHLTIMFALAAMDAPGMRSGRPSPPWFSEGR